MLQHLKACRGWTPWILWSLGICPEIPGSAQRSPHLLKPRNSTLISFFGNWYETFTIVLGACCLLKWSQDETRLNIKFSPIWFHKTDASDALHCLTGSWFVYSKEMKNHHKLDEDIVFAMSPFSCTSHFESHKIYPNPCKIQLKRLPKHIPENSQQEKSPETDPKLLRIGFRHPCAAQRLSSLCLMPLRKLL